MSAFPYIARPGENAMTEPQKRLLSWNMQVAAGAKHSFAGIDPAEREKRRAAGKRQRAARKANR